MPGQQRRPSGQPASRLSWVTQADRAVWQRLASAKLSAILAEYRDLPAITWTITTGGGLTGRALVPGDPRGTWELFNAWRRALELHDRRETPTGDGTSYVRAHASRGTIRVTLTAVVASLDATDNRGSPGPRPVQAAGASEPDVDATSAQPWARRAPPPGPVGPSPR